MFIQTEETPNPLTLKFLPGRAVLAPEDGDLIEFLDEDDAMRSPLAESLFAIDGVCAVFLGRDFISVTRDEDVPWEGLKSWLLEAIMDHFLSGDPILLSRADREALPDDEVVRQICTLLNTRVRPVVAQDGGDITFHRFEDGIVYLTMRGACAGCPNATATLKMGVERLLRQMIPEVVEVRQVPLDHK